MTLMTQESSQKTRLLDLFTLRVIPVSIFESLMLVAQQIGSLLVKALRKELIMLKTLRLKVQQTSTQLMMMVHLLLLLMELVVLLVF
jgi:hypothetical protein